MIKSKLIYTKLIENKSIAKNIYRMILKIPSGEDAFERTIPGQFINIYLEHKDSLLPRPISICMVKGDEIYLVYKAVGKGTERMALIRAGEKVKISTPMGNGFTCMPNKKVLLIAGGAGIPPMVALALKLKQLNCQVTGILGFKDESFLVRDMEECCDEVFVAMEERADGFKGNIVELLKEGNYTGEECFACGPKAMLKEVNSYCESKDITLQVSLEERMGCGYGACLGCAITINSPEPLKLRVCKDGPVFRGSQVAWDE